jgi:hypothetical protein
VHNWYTERQYSRFEVRLGALANKRRIPLRDKPNSSCYRLLQHRLVLSFDELACPREYVRLEGYRSSLHRLRDALLVVLQSRPRVGVTELCLSVFRVRPLSEMCGAGSAKSQEVEIGDAGFLRQWSQNALAIVVRTDRVQVGGAAGSGGRE